MRRFMLLAAGYALMAGSAHAQTLFQVKPNSVSKVEFHSSNYGIFGINIQSGNASFTYPRGSGMPYIYGAGLWFGTQKRVNNELTPLTFITCDPNRGESWGYPGEYWPNHSAASPDIYFSTDYDHATGRFSGTGSKFDWPLWLGSGMNASPMFPGVFEPLNSERSSEKGVYPGPSFVTGVDDQVFSRYNSANIQRYAEKIPGFPLHLQIQQNIFAWANGAYESAVLIQYQIVNKSTDTLFNCVAGQVTDLSLGQHMNDHIRFFHERPDLRAAYVWSEPEPRAPKVVGMALIEAPVTDAQGFVSTDRRGEYRLQGRAGSCAVWEPANAPKNSQPRYATLTSGMPANDIGPTDVQTALASTPFSMYPGDTAYFAMIYAIVDNVPNLNAPSEQSQLEKLITSITADYYEHGTFSSPAAASRTRPATGLALTASPNPAGDHVTISMNLAEPCDARLRLTNSLGETVLARNLEARPAGINYEHIDATGLPVGLYLVTVEAGGRMNSTRLVLK